jgi:pimeloyl-ACP methyl ester carboxylesterase
LVDETGEPWFDGEVRLRDGRALAYAEWGDPTGRPVAFFHGSPNSRLFCPDPEATLAAGVRLVTPDRPGSGRSDPMPGRSVADWADDFLELADLLELPPCPIIGLSSGGPYALACAARLQGRVRSVGLVSSVAPLDEVPGGWDALSAEARHVAQLLRQAGQSPEDRRVAEALAARRLDAFAADPTAIPPEFPSDENPDWVVFRDRPAVFERWLRGRREAARQGVAGYAEDWIAQVMPWGFAMTDVRCPVRVWWGDRDWNVERADTDCLVRLLPGCTTVTYPGEGHIIAVTHWAEILASLA